MAVIVAGAAAAAAWPRPRAALGRADKRVAARAAARPPSSFHMSPRVLDVRQQRCAPAAAQTLFRAARGTSVSSTARVAGVHPTLRVGVRVLARQLRPRMQLMLQLLHVTFSCDDPARARASSGRQLLDYETSAAGESGSRPTRAARARGSLFNRMPKSPTIELPIHVDVSRSGPRGRAGSRARARRLARGDEVAQRRRPRGEVDGDARPGGNGFCIQSPPNTERRRSAMSRSPAPSRGSSDGSGRARSAGPTKTIDEGFLQKLRDAGSASATSAASTSPGRPGRTARASSFSAERSRGPSPIRSISTLATDDREAEIERLTAAGATVVGDENGDERHVHGAARPRRQSVLRRLVRDGLRSAH